MSLRDANASRPNNRKRKRITMVVANPATSTTTGWPVGFWWSELTHPYLAFEEAGYEIEVFSPNGGRKVSDPGRPTRAICGDRPDRFCDCFERPRHLGGALPRHRKHSPVHSQLAGQDPG